MIFKELNSGPSEEKLENIVESWWNVYKHNSTLALEELAVVLFNSAGIKTDQFNISEFFDENHKEQIFSSNTIISYIPLSKIYFFETLKKFMDQIFQKNFWGLLQNESFINKFLAMIEVMKVSPWDSLRAVSFLSGMKILRHSYHYLMALHTNKIEKTRIDKLWNKVYICVFRYSFRDKSPHLRSIPLTELISWSKETPKIIMKSIIIKHILRGLRDSFIRNCKYSLILCTTVFVKPLIIEKQQQIIESLIPELIIFLTKNEEFAFLSLKIVNLALGFLNVTIGTYEDLNFSMCLYNEHESVVEEAKLYFHSTHFKNKSGIDIIVETFTFYKKCPVKNVSKLVHGLVTYFVAYTSWQDWEYCLKSLDNLCDYLKLLYEYIYIINNESENIKGLFSSEVHKIKNEFSIFFIEHWIKLLDLDKVIIKSNAQVSVLKLLTLCDVSKLHKKAHTEIIDRLMYIFHESQSFEVLKESLLTIQFINYHNKNAECEKKIVSQITTELFEILNSEHEETYLLNVIHYKFILLVKNIEHDYKATWASLVCLLEQTTDFQKIGVIISVLYHLLMKILKIYINFKSDLETVNNDSVNIEEKRFQGFILESQLSNWSSTVIRTASAFVENIHHHFNGDTNLLVIPRMYGELINLSKSEFLSGFSFKFSDQEIESYIVCCTKVMLLDCKRNGAEFYPCCLLLRDYVKFTIDGNISVLYLKYFIMNLVKINSHTLIIIDMLNHLIKVELGPVVALVLINGFICIYNEGKEKGDNAETIQENLKAIVLFFFKNLVDMEGKDCQMTGLHLYLYLKKLISEGYNIFSNISEIVKSTLCETIINKLTEEN